MSRPATSLWFRSIALVLVLLLGPGSTRALAFERGCPPGQPVLCPDGVCRASIFDCAGLAPDCTVTCADGRCAADLLQCAEGGVCPQAKPVRCADGSCVADQLLCPFPSPCATTTCADGRCVDSPEDCAGFHAGCPSTKPVRCLDGTCRASAPECDPSQSCPPPAILCADGRCAADEVACDAGGACPADLPIRCPDGSCAPDTVSCGMPHGCPLVTCADGTCADLPEECADRGACPADRPVRCADGRCRRSALTCDPIVDCPDTHPIRCADGRCVERDADCGASGCSSTSPLRCEDGRCVANRDDCWVAPPCPQAAPIRCRDGSCVATLEDCRVFEGVTDGDGDGIEDDADPDPSTPGGLAAATGGVASWAIALQAIGGFFIFAGLLARKFRKANSIELEWQPILDDQFTALEANPLFADQTSGQTNPLFDGTDEDYVKLGNVSGSSGSASSGSLILTIYEGPVTVTLGTSTAITIESGSRITLEEAGPGIQLLTHELGSTGSVGVQDPSGSHVLAPGESMLVAGNAGPVPASSTLGAVLLALMLMGIAAVSLVGWRRRDALH